MIATNLYLKLFTIFSTLLFLASCNQTKNESSETQVNYIISGDTITLGEKSNITPKLKFIKTSLQDYSNSLETYGVVKSIPNSYAEISSPFNGRVSKLLIKLGQKVNAGTPLFEVYSPEFFEAQKNYFDAKQELHLANLTLKRQQDLVKHGVGIRRELEEAETQYAIKKSNLNNTSASLKVFKTDSQNTVLGQPLIVRSPISGEILTNNVILGQYLKEDTETLILVAELSKVWVAASIKEKDLSHISNLKEVQLKLDAFPDKTFTGKIFNVNKLVDEETRSIEVLIECDNPQLTFKPGMYVNVLFKDTPQVKILIPTKSLFQESDKEFVFVKIDKNRFIKKLVQTGESFRDQTLIKKGLEINENVVSEGGSFLNKTH